jgi:hypothetical protein
MDRTAWYIFLFIVLCAANIIIVNNFNKSKGNPCQTICVEGYKYLVCGTFKSGVVQMMEGEGDDIFITRCKQ